MFSSSIEERFSSVPTVQTDGNLKIIGANGAAIHLGVHTGETLHVRTEADAQKFRRLYDACVSAMRNTDTDTRKAARHCVRIPLSAFHGFRTAFVRFEYSLAGTLANVMLFRTQKEYLLAVPAYSEYYPKAVQLITAHFDRLRERCTELLASPDVSKEALAESLDESLAAIRLSARLLAPLACEDSKKKRLFPLSAFLDSYLSAVLPHLKAVDCEIERADGTGARGRLFPMDAGAVFLLLTTLLDILNTLSADGHILLTQSSYGQDGEIRLSTRAAPSALPLMHTFDLSAVASAFPQTETSCAAAEYLAEITDTYIDLFTNDTEGHVTLSLYLPSEKQTGDFKSPKGADEDIREALCCMRGLLSLGGIFTARSAKEPE